MQKNQTVSSEDLPLCVRGSKFQNIVKSDCFIRKSANVCQWRPLIRVFFRYEAESERPPVAQVPPHIEVQNSKIQKNQTVSSEDLLLCVSGGLSSESFFAMRLKLSGLQLHECHNRFSSKLPQYIKIRLYHQKICYCVLVAAFHISLL